MDVRRGMTLIEIIISIAIIALIAIGIIPAFATNYKMIIFTRSLTKNTYSAQKDMEDKIENLKDCIDKNTKIEDPLPNDYRIFISNNGGININNYSPDGSYLYIKKYDAKVKIKALGNDDSTTKRVVSAYSQGVFIKNREDKNSGKRLFTVVANVNRPKNETPVENNTQIALYNNANAKVYFAYPNESMLKIKATFEAVKLDKNGNPSSTGSSVPVLKYINHWYVSNSGYYISQYDPPDESVIGIKYPSFPKDYTIIADANAQSLSTIDGTFAGRHIVYTITGAAYSGVMGPYDISANSIYFSGLTVTNNLLLHLDASLLDRYTKDSSGNYTYVDNNRLNVKGWNDLSRKMKNSFITTVADQPVYSEYIFEGDVNTHNKYVGCIAFKDSSDKVVLSKSTNLDLSKFCMLVAFNTSNSNTNKNIIKTDKWSLSINATNKLLFTCNGQTISAESVNVCDGKWHIAMIKPSGLYIDNDKKVVVPAALTGNISYSSVTIGEGYIGSIGEVIGYSDITVDDNTKVMTYLKDKYNIN